MWYRILGQIISAVYFVFDQISTDIKQKIEEKNNYIRI